MVKVRDNAQILDVGCGDGRTTLALYKKNKTAHVDAFDADEGQIDFAQVLLRKKHLTKQEINFFCQDANDFLARNKYDIVFSNLAMQWIGGEFYRQIFECLVPGGMMYVYQICKGTYWLLHGSIIPKAIKTAGLSEFYEGWHSPMYLPSKKELESHLDAIGFADVSVKMTVDKDTGAVWGGKDKLIDAFAIASLPVYYPPIPKDKWKLLEQTFKRVAKQTNPEFVAYDLWIKAMKPF
jgi:cyclopropane fatty-acyl-phospholipid synthase-like methyltransferase